MEKGDCRDERYGEDFKHIGKTLEWEMLRSSSISPTISLQQMSQKVVVLQGQSTKRPIALKRRFDEIARHNAWKLRYWLTRKSRTLPTNRRDRQRAKTKCHSSISLQRVTECQSGHSCRVYGLRNQHWDGTEPPIDRDDKADDRSTWADNVAAVPVFRASPSAAPDNGRTVGDTSSADTSSAGT